MSYKQTFLQFPRLGQSVDGSALIRADLAVELAGDADKEIAILRAENAQLREQLAAQSRALIEKTQQVESLRAELSERGDATAEKVRGLEAELEKLIEAAREQRLSVQMTTIDRARVEAEFNELMRLASPLGATMKEIKAAHKRLLGGKA